MSNKTPSVEDDEELDFMSDVFLAQCAEKDVRPGLLHNPRDKRDHELKKKHNEANQANKFLSKKSLLQLEDEQRTEKLNQEIDSQNKGFRMLEKMGYKPGMSIGPEGRDNGLKVPLPIEMKRTRGGLGEKTKIAEKKRKIEEQREELVKLSDPAAYRARLREIADEKVTFRDLKTAQSSCQSLDTTAGVTTPLETWFWKEVEKPKPDSDDESGEEEINEDEEESTEPEPREKLDALLIHLREKYFYCIWCGTAYDSAEDFKTNCPGPTRDDH